MGEESNKPKSRENEDFVMYYRPFIDALTDMAGKNYTAYRLFQLLCKHMDGYNALSVSMITLSELMGVSRQTVNSAVNYLKKNGWIGVLKNGNTNVYVVNSDVAWTSYANQKQYCKFNGTFLLSGTENNEFLKNPKATNRYKGIDSDFVREVMKKQAEHREQAEQQIEEMECS